MISPGDDTGVLLTTMGEFQDQEHVRTGDHAYPTMVCASWEFHESRSGFGREKICRLLPQLVGDGLAQGLGAGMVWGYRVSEGYAWISIRGQDLLAQWRQSPAPDQGAFPSLSPHAAEQLQSLLAKAPDSGVSRGDIDRLTALCTEDIEPAETAPAGEASGLARFLNGNAELSNLIVSNVLPYLRSVVRDEDPARDKRGPEVSDGRCSPKADATV